MLAQGVCTGLGNGITFSSGLAVMSSCFAEKRALAIGMASGSSSTGGLIYPVVANQLLYRRAIGYGWTIQDIGLIMLATQIP